MATKKNIKINLDYSQFSGGISECQRKMGLLTEEFKLQQSALGNNASRVDKLKLSQDMLSQKIALQVQVVEQASEKFKALSASEDATEKQVDSAQRAFMRQLTTLNNLRNDLSSVTDELVEAAEAEDEMSESSNKASDSNVNLAANVAASVTAITALVTAVKELATQFREISTQSTQWADDLSTLSAQIGVSTTTLQEWGYAADFVDVSVETLQSSMARLTMKMSDAQSGSSSARAAFDNLKVSVTNADGSLRSTESVFYDVIDALGEIENASERDAQSMAIFGKSAQELNSLIETGSSSFNAYGQQAEALGLIMSESDVQALAQMQDSVDRLDAVLTASSERVSAAVAPAYAGFANVISALDPAFLDVATGAGKFLQVVGSSVGAVNTYVQTLATLRIAKNITTMATYGEAQAEVGLGIAATGANMALAPQIIMAGVLVAAIAAIVLALKKLIDYFKEEADAADKAAASTQKFAKATTGTEAGNAKTEYGTAHYALGGRVANGRQVWVGEQGAELVDLPVGSTVYNHQESRNMTSSHNVFNVTIDAKSVDDFNKVVNVFSGLSQSMNRGGFVNG